MIISGLLLLHVHQDRLTDLQIHIYRNLTITENSYNHNTVNNSKFNGTDQKMMPHKKSDYKNSSKKRNGQLNKPNSMTDLGTQKMMPLKKPGLAKERKNSNTRSSKHKVKMSNHKVKVSGSVITNTTTDLEINSTHINGVLMEPVNANYTRNIYFTVKTTYKYYSERLFPLMLTWLQVMDKNKVSHF